MTTPKTPKKSTPKVAKPSEIVDDSIELDEIRKELLADLPALRPAHRFRLAHRNAFADLTLNAIKSGAFEGDGALEFDTNNPEDIERLQKLQAFVASIDEWAESIAEDKDAYIAWAEGKTEEHFMALFRTYQVELGESQRS